VLELAQQARVSESEIDRLRQQVASLESRLAGGAPVRAVAPAATPPPPARASRPPSSPPPAPRGVEEDELAAEELDVVPAPAAPAARPAAPARPGAPPAAAPVAAQPVPREAQAIYDDAYTLYHQGRYEQAERRFEEFLAASPRTELSDNAQYWIGAARFARRDFRGALAAFRTTVELYPAENKVPDALFKMGQALEELGDPGEAQTVYRDLVQRFPDTAAATLADERLGQLR
jgi:tol-pal system protein YbgF